MTPLPCYHKRLRTDENCLWSNTFTDVVIIYFLSRFVCAPPRPTRSEVASRCRNRFTCQDTGSSIGCTGSSHSRLLNGRSLIKLCPRDTGMSRVESRWPPWCLIGKCGLFIRSDNHRTVIHMTHKRCVYLFVWSRILLFRSNYCMCVCICHLNSKTPLCVWQRTKPQNTSINQIGWNSPGCADVCA